MTNQFHFLVNVLRKILERRFIAVSFVLLVLSIGHLFAQNVTVQSYTSDVDDSNPMTHSLTSVPANALLVLTTTCQYGSPNTQMYSTPSLTWTLQKHATSTGGAKIYTAVFAAGGNITVTSQWDGAPNRYQASVCYVVTNYESPLAGASASGSGEHTPAVAITTTRNNSLIFCATSDWNATTGTVAYRGTPTPSYVVGNGAARFYHYYYGAATAGEYTVGMTAPDMDGGASTAALEIRSPDSDVTAPSAPTLSTSAISNVSIGLSWTAATDNVGVTEYEVYVGGVLNGTTSSTTYTILNLTHFTQYSVYVKAKDAAGNGTNSNTITPRTAGIAWTINGNTAINPSTNFLGTTDAQPLIFKTGNSQRMLISADGYVGIGTSSIPSSTTYRLYVDKGIRTEKVKVDLIANWPDYVFDKQYKLLTLKELEDFINKNKHLPGVPAAEEIKKEGIDLGNNQGVLLEKIEELTLYLIELNKTVEKLSKENEILKQALKTKTK